MIESFEKEVDSMKNFKHENLINIIAANKNGLCVSGNEKENIMYLGVELAENAELFDFIADPGRAFSEESARYFFTQLIAGLKSMHDLKVAHRDLKTENLFLDDQFRLKIGDFGFSKFMCPTTNDGKLKTQLGTSGYQSPELLEGQFYDGASNDIFACGVILFILVKAYPPFREARRTDNWYRHLYYDKVDNFWALHTKKGSLDISKELKELITGMLRYKNRFTMKDILESDWLSKGQMPNENDFFDDMKNRKVKVDERRNQEAIEASSNNVGDNLNSKIYRGENEDKLVEKLVNELKEYGCDKFPVKYWDDHNIRHAFKFEGTDVGSVYTNLIKTLVNEKATISLSDKEYKLEASLPFVEKVEIDVEGEIDPVICNFIAEAYVDINKDCVIVELIKERNTDAFSFKNMFDSLNNKYFK